MIMPSAVAARQRIARENGSVAAGMEPDSHGLGPTPMLSKGTHRENGTDCGVDYPDETARARGAPDAHGARQTPLFYREVIR